MLGHCHCLRRVSKQVVRHLHFIAVSPASGYFFGSVVIKSHSVTTAVLVLR